ncbi:DUF6279 family lipoprotein [Kangiella koreensis]|uniref:Lipoprotein n=1 Tax=Kangiella koreensis (strain DSM 16069 / JCM 12317 / KCTC 12182 / SW-125) TaxID=523791 RepID=C7R5M8_KANKD|nr:DUF6279 family lipoprotein [Kangiella koreensis]ACV27202.1 conserved hypothetical protein [Kangiella koreensis DSM 16069]
MTNLNKSSRILIVLLGVFFIQACGIKFWYNRLDWVVPWYLDDYVELNSQQEDTLEQLLELKTEWHRSNELPKYVSMLNRMEADIKSGAIHQTYDRYQRDMRGFYNTLLDEMSDNLVAQTASLTDEQVKQLMDNLDKEAKKQYEEFKEKTDEERQEERLERLEDSFDEWIGSLNDDQEELIKEMASLLKSSGEVTYQYRAKWRDAFRTALAERKTEGGKAAIKSLITDPYQVGGEELNKIREYNGNIYKEYQLKIFRTLSAKQKRHLLEEIADYREDFEDLIDD